MNEIGEQTREVVRELIENAASLRENDIVVIGCSTSEVAGKCIGTASSEEIAQEIMDAALPAFQERGVFLAVQGCEHLNRALVVERACMERYDLTEVSVRPWLKAGGAFATLAFERFDDPVMVEDLRAKARAGIDIGGTFIGMHLRPVVVPIHAKYRRIGDAVVTMARTRPKYVGGPRAHYPEQ
ncbi:MAG: TIGR01440 family protein [Bacillota bacterium]